MVKNLPAVQETQARFLGREGPPEGMAPSASFLAWEIPWTEEPGGLQSLRAQESENNAVTKQLVCCLGEDVKGTDRSQGEASTQPQLKEQAIRAGLGGFPGTRGFTIVQGHRPREHCPSQSGL